MAKVFGDYIGVSEIMMEGFTVTKVSIESMQRTAA